MNKKIVNIFFALAVVVVPQSVQADELGKILGATLGTIISVVSFRPADRILTLAALNQLGGYLGSKVDVVPSASKHQATTLTIKKKVQTPTDNYSKGVPWYARSLAKGTDNPSVVVSSNDVYE